MTLNRIDEHKNTNGIQVSQLDDTGEGVIEAGVTTLAPGMAVGKGTATGSLKLAVDAVTCLGVALENRLVAVGGDIKTLRTVYAAGERVRYGRQPGWKFMGLVQSGETLVKGSYITPDTDGKWIAATVATACARCIQESGTGGALGADGYFLCKWGVDA